MAWGRFWRMPTKEEMSELLDTDKCIWTWTTVNDVRGYEVKSKINGNTIFLPAAGNRWRESFYTRGMLGSYWTNSVNLKESGFAYYLEFQENNIIVQAGLRRTGLVVRPVMP